MEAIRFQAEIKNGIIEIPKQYVGQIAALATVSVMPNTQKPKRRYIDGTFTVMKTDVKNYKFNREEANERR
ncbi:MAG: hypothetical protein LBT79_02670 [Elusimicrobiota bacterium]|jgi:hypothetical protein|nr:hypothetical protein [Elusimicrobiota bacterium]